jgi:hypothetical protein
MLTSVPLMLFDILVYGGMVVCMRGVKRGVSRGEVEVELSLRGERQ